MANMSNYLRDKYLNVNNLQTFTAPAALYVAFCSSAPVATNTGATIPELTSAGGYARIPVTLNAASGGQVQNAVATGTASTGAYSAAATYWAICDSATILAGNLWWFGPMQGTNAVQTITTSAQLTAGTYTLAFGGQTTPAISFNDPATRILEMLESLSTIGAGNVTVAFSGNRFDQATPGSLVVTFVGTLASAAQTVMTLTPTGITGGTLSISTTTVGAPGTITISGTGQTPSIPVSNITIALS